MLGKYIRHRTESFLRGHARRMKRLRELEQRLSEAESHGDIHVQEYARPCVKAGMSDPVCEYVGTLEELSRKARELREKVRRVERFRKRLFERGRWSVKHERMRMILDMVYLGGMKWSEYVRHSGVDAGTMEELRDELISRGARELFCVKY